MVTQFCYLGGVLDSEGGLRGQLEPKWLWCGAKWREISGVLLYKGILLARRGMVFDACIRSVLLRRGP